MSTHARPRRRIASIEPLEGRRLLSTTSNYYSSLAYNARHSYDQFVTEVQLIELQSQATPAQYLALRDDSRAISEAASATGLSPNTAYAKSVAVSVQIDRSLLYGSFSDQAWAGERSRLGTDLAGTNVPQPLIDKTISDEKAASASAGVLSDQYQSFNDDLNQTRRDEHRVPNGYAHPPDPGLFYSQHVRGFFRGWAVQRTHDEVVLSADLRSIHAAGNASPADSAAVNRDAQILENLGVPIPSPANNQIHDDYVAAFAQGVPTASQLAKLRTQIVASLGSTATPPRIATVDRLISDAPAFYRGVGLSSVNVSTIANDVQAVVNDGAGASLDPFKVTIRGANGRG